MATCTVTMNFRDGIDDSIPANVEVTPIAVQFGNPIVAPATRAFNVANGGTFDLYQGDRLGIAVTNWGPNALYYIEVPELDDIDFDELVVSFSIDKLSGTPAMVLPRSVLELARDAVAAAETAETSATTASSAADSASASAAAAEAVGTTNDGIVAAIVGDPDSATAEVLVNGFPALDGVDRHYSPFPGKTNGWEAIWDAAAGYLVHARTGAGTTGNNAVIGIGTDKGAGHGILVSHKNDGSGIRLIHNPSGALGLFVSGYALNPAAFFDQYVGAGPSIAIRYHTGNGYKDGVTTVGSTTFTSATASFAAGDVGQSLTQIAVRSIDDPTGCIPDGTTIVSVTNATTVVMSAPAGATGSGINFRVAGRAVNESAGIFEGRNSDDSVFVRLSKANGLQFNPSDSTTPSLRVKGKSGQTNNMFEVVNYAAAAAVLTASENGIGGAMGISISNASNSSRRPLLVINYAAASEAVRIQHAVTSPTADMIVLTDNSSAVLSRFNKAGYFITKKTSAPADADLNAGELSFWLDATNGAAMAMFKAKQADGTVRTGSVALS